MRAKLLLAEEMPPEPASGIFHARSIGKFIEHVPSFVPDSNGNIPARRVLPIHLRDVTFPLTFAWNIKGENLLKYWLLVNRQGGRARIPISGEGNYSLTSDSLPGNTLLVEVQPNNVGPPPCESKTAHRPVGENPLKQPLDQIPGISKPSELSQSIQSDDNHQLRFTGKCIVSLRVYNMLGVVVRSVVEGSQQAGYKSVSVDMSGLSSGIYFYQMKAGKFSDMKKLVVIK